MIKILAELIEQSKSSIASNLVDKISEMLQD